LHQYFFPVMTSIHLKCRSLDITVLL